MDHKTTRIEVLITGTRLVAGMGNGDERDDPLLPPSRSQSTRLAYVTVVETIRGAGSAGKDEE